MKIYIIKDTSLHQHNETFIRAFANKKKAISFKSKLTRGIKKAYRYYDGCIKLQIHDIPISKKGILTAVNNLK